MSDQEQLGGNSPRGSIANRPGDIARRVISKQDFNFDGWTILVQKSTILPSQCYCDSVNESSTTVISDVPMACSPERNGGSGMPSSSTVNLRCNVCRYETELKIKHLPEMIFPDNILRVTHQGSELALEFNALDALKMISDKPESVHVAGAQEWKAAQEGGPLPDEIKYDWTFSTDYKGTLTPSKSGLSNAQNTEDKLNLEKLKERENILFYEELSLYEDELHDNGTSNLSVKIRVMPSGFFILQRFFLRVDNVMAKICDTRVYYEAGNNYFLREFQERRESIQALSNLPANTFTDANVLYSHLPVRSVTTEKVQVI